ncbi:MAG: hypothetical protein QW751_02385, partial [Candidatus Aenigmatarchaeota archaeon]
TVLATATSVPNNALTNVSGTLTKGGDYAWYVECSDSADNKGMSEVRYMTYAVLNGMSCTFDRHCISGCCLAGTCGICPPISTTIPPPKPPEEKPPEVVPEVVPEVPQKVPAIWPQPCSGWIAGQPFEIPVNCSIKLIGEFVDGKPAEGTVAILLYPKTTPVAIVHNLTQIVPEQLAALAIGQVALDGHEINITADEIHYCMNYKGLLGNIDPSTVSVWKLSEGKWQELPANMVLHDTDVVCGNITGAGTPYMIAGFVPVITTTPELAWAAIQDANSTIEMVAASGVDVTAARALLAQAVDAYNAGKYDTAKSLAEQARLRVTGWLHSLVIAGVLLVLVVLVIFWWLLKKRVKPKVRKK